MYSVREAILFFGGVREREEKKKRKEREGTRYAARIGATPIFHP